MGNSTYNAVFIVRTPYHYINALEAAYSYGIDRNKSALIIWSKHPGKKFDNFVDKEQWKAVEHLPVLLRNNKDSLIGWGKERIKDIEYIFRSIRTASRLGKIELCFSILPDDTQIQHIINKLGSKKVVILDEGVATFGFAKNYLDRREKEVDSTIFGFDRRRNQDFEFFTSFPLSKYVKKLKEEKVRRHSFEYTKSKIDFKNIGHIKGLILGTQRLGKIKCKYDKFMSLSLKFINCRPDKIWYKPHRWETDDEINKTKRKYNLKVIDNRLPVEVILSTSNVAPNKVSGFASTAIHSINKIFERRIEKSVVFGINKCDKKLPYIYFESGFENKVKVRHI